MSNPAPGFKKYPKHTVTTRPAERRVQVRYQGELIADSASALEMHETHEGSVIAPVMYYLPRQDVRKSPRVPVRLDFSYWLLDDKVVRPEGARGVIRDIGYNGVLAELEQALPRHAELKLAFELPALGYRATDVYARIVASREQDGRHLAGMEFTSLADETRKLGVAAPRLAR